MSSGPALRRVVGVAFDSGSSAVERHTSWHDSSAPTASAASPTARSSPPSWPSTSRSRPRASSAEAGADAGPPSHRGRRPRPARLGRVPLRRRRRRAGVGRGRRLRRRGAAHPGRRLPDRRPRGRLRGHALGVAQRRCPTTASSSSPAAGTSWPTTSRTASRPRMGEPWAAPDRRRRRPRRPLTDGHDPLHLRTCCAVLPQPSRRAARSSSTAAHGAASMVVARGVPARRAPTSSVIGTSPRRPQHQRRLRLDAPRARSRRAVVGARRGPRHRPRRRRRPVPGRGRHRRRGRRRPDHGHPRRGDEGARRAGQRHPRRHRDEQPRAAAARMEREGIRRAADRRSATATCWRRCARGGYSLGGEQSGHVIILDHGTTGDGVLTGLMLAARMAATGRSIADLAAVMTRLPQVLVNVRGCRQGPGRERRGPAVGGPPGGGRARRRRPGAAAQVGHRAARAGHGRGADPGAGGCRGRPPRGRRAGAPHPLTPLLRSRLIAKYPPHLALLGAAWVGISQ